MKKFIKNFLIILILIYLIISSLYILSHVNFNEPPMVVGMGFSSKTNIIRNFFGLPSTYSTYNGVSPHYLWHVLFRVLLIIIFSKILLKNNKNNNKK